MTVAAIVVTYNSEDHIEKCVKSIKGADEIIVVDSDSTDNTKEIVKELDCQKIFLEENVGYGKGNNIAIHNTNAEFILILNPDTVIEKDTVKKLKEEYDAVSKMAETEKVIISPKVKLKNGRLNYFGADINFLGFGTINDLNKKDNIDVVRKETKSITGSAFFMKTKHFHALDGFDQDYFLYHEDTDFSLRALQRGFKIYATNKTFITHLCSMEDFKLTPLKYYNNEKNRYVTVIKNMPLPNIVCLVLFEPVMVIHSILTGKFFKRLKIYWFLVKNLGKIIKKRDHVKKLDLDYKMKVGHFIGTPFAKFIEKAVNAYAWFLYIIFI